MSSDALKLNEEALKRRERLKNLRQHIVDNNDDSHNNNEDQELPKPVFRSYIPQDDSLKENQLPKAKPESVEVQVQSHLEAAKPEPLIEEVDLASLAPRKPDWDLKRDVAKKLEKLERRTQRAIAELIRERLELNIDKLAESVNSANPDEDSD